MKIFQGKSLQSKYPRSIKMDFSVRNVGQGSWFERNDKQAQIVFQGDLNQGSFHERSFFIVFSLIFLSSYFFLILHFS